MKDFDSELRAGRKQEQFKIGGETFTLRESVRPEVMLEWEDMDPSVITATEALAISDRLIVAMMADADAEERWRRVRARDDDAIAEGDIHELLRWMLTTVTRRPPTPSASSSDGGEPREGGSTDGSPLAAVPSTA